MKSLCGVLLLLLSGCSYGYDYSQFGVDDPATVHSYYETGGEAPAFEGYETLFGKPLSISEFAIIETSKDLPPQD